MFEANIKSFMSIESSIKPTTRATWAKVLLRWCYIQATQTPLSSHPLRCRCRPLLQEAKVDACFVTMGVGKPSKVSTQRAATERMSMYIWVRVFERFGGRKRREKHACNKTSPLALRSST